MSINTINNNDAIKNKFIMPLIPVKTAYNTTNAILLVSNTSTVYLSKNITGDIMDGQNCHISYYIINIIRLFC
jgi:hypothetical protein